MSGRMPERGLLSLIPLALLACGDGSSSDKGPPPAAPSNLAAPTVTSGRIGLSWTDQATDEFGFSVERSLDGATWTEIGTTAADTTVFTDIGLTANTTYHYRVRAVGQGGWSGYTTVLVIPTANMTWEAGPASPGPLTARQGHSAVYDSLNQRMVVFGGEDGTFLNEVWVLPLTDANLAGAAWSLLGTTGTAPSGRFSHAAIYDPVRNRMVVFGGRAGTPLNSDVTNEVWVLTLPDESAPSPGTPTWSKLTLPFGPSARAFHSAIYDAANDRMVVFGGSSSGAVSSEVWGLRFSGPSSPSWVSLGNATIDSIPLELSEHTAIYDPINQRMIVHGGTKGAPGLNGVVYEATLPTVAVPQWSVLTSAMPPMPRLASSAVYDAAHRRMVVFGGYEDIFLPAFDDTWTLPLDGPPVWTAVLPMNTPAPGRAYASVVYDPLFERMVLFAGQDTENLVPVDNLAWPLKF